MTKLFTIAVAMATLAFGGVALAGGGGNGGGGGTAKFDSEVTLKFKPGPYDPYDPYYYEESVFKGKVKATPANKTAEKSDYKKKCTKGRKVVIKQGSTKFDQTKTDEQGKYSVPAADAYSEPGTYRAKVLKKKKKKIDLKCEAATSNPVTVP